MAREGSETAAQREGSLWQDKPVLLFMLFFDTSAKTAFH